MRKFYHTLLLLLFCLSAHAQTNKISIRGKVTDLIDGTPLPSLTIIEKGTTNGSTTDINGDYVIEVNENAVLVFSFVGYKTKEFTVLNRSVLDVSLDPDVTTLQDVVVVGYGTQQKKDITGAMGSVKNSEFKDQPTTNVAGNLQGKMAGVNITSSSGTPGAGLLVSIRGSSNPLYVVDGIPMLSESNSAIATSFDTEGNVVGSGQNVSSIADINPNDIESVDVMKDASATAIYGARAANGVVFITTKRGSTGKTKFNFNYYGGTQTVARKIDFLNSDEFIELTEEARANDLALYNNDNTIFGAGFDPSILTDPLNYSTDGTNTVWLDEVLQNAAIHNYELSASGGDKKTKFYVGGSYFDQDGIVINSGFKRLTARVNLDHQASDKLSFGLNSSVSRSNNRRSFNDNTYTGIITNAIGASPLMPVYDEFGNYSNYEDYQVNWLSDNPVLSANEIIATTTSSRLIGSVFAEYKFNSKLKFRTSWSTDYSLVGDNQFFSPITADAEAVSGRAFKGVFEQLTWLNENILTYATTINSTHNITALAGFTMQETLSEYTSVNGQGFPSGSGLQRLSSAAVITNATNTFTGFGLVSYLGRFNYDYKGKYFFSVTSRLDGSSRFSKGDQYAFFPSFSAGWTLSEESFFGKSDTFNYLKIRGSYGVTGDQEIGNFQNISFWQPSRYNGQSGLRPRNLADPNLSWQSNKQVNIGLDWELFNGKISGSVDYFKSNKVNLLSNDLIAGTTGFSSITRNAGEIENRGWEFSISSTPIATNKFKWNTNFNISFIKNEIIDLTNDGQLVSAYSDLAPTHVLKKGEAVGTFWAIKYLGVDPQTGDALFYDLETQSPQTATSGLIDSDDAQIAGKAIPDFFGGWNNTFNFGRFDALLAFQYSVGNDVYNLIRATYQNVGWSNEGGLDQVYANNWAGVNDRWRNPGDKTDIPRASFINQNYVENSTMFIEDGSFFRIRTVSLGYTLKPKKAAWVNSIRLYAQVQNLHVFTNYVGFDPEVSSTGGGNPQTAGIDYAAYPQPRTFTFGFNLGF